MRKFRGLREKEMTEQKQDDIIRGRKMKARSVNMRLVFIRHLPVPGNEMRQYIGLTDEDLSVRAVTEFRKRCEGIRGKAARADSGKSSSGGAYPSVQYVIASPLKRCVQTAELIFPGQEIHTDSMLRECDFGEYEGKTYEELKNEPQYIQWLESGGMAAFPGGEEQTAFRRRCVDGVKKWTAWLLDEGAKSAAFVVHGGTIMAALSELAENQKDFYYWQAENGGGYEAEVREADWKNGRKVLRNIKRLTP